MTASPRIVRPRAVALPSAPRFRRVAGVNTRPLGRVSLVLAATCVLGLTALLYLSQIGQAAKTSIEIQRLTLQLDDATNRGTILEDRIRLLQTYGTVYGKARRLGMVPVDPSKEHFITAPGPITVRYVYVAPPAPARPAAVAVHLSTTDATMSSWWQGLWSALYHAMH